MEVGGDVTKLNNISNPFQNISICFLEFFFKKSSLLRCAIYRKYRIEDFFEMALQKSVALRYVAQNTVSHNNTRNYFNNNENAWSKEIKYDIVKWYA